MQVKKSQLEVLYFVLKGTEGVLNLTESRKRDSFMKKLTTELDTFYTERKAIFEKLCDKKEDGTPDIKNDQYVFAPETKEELTKELTTLLEEEVSLEGDIKDLIEKSEYKPKVGETEIIDSLCAN